MDKGALTSLLRALLPASQLAATNEQVTLRPFSRVHPFDVLYLDNTMLKW